MGFDAELDMMIAYDMFADQFPIKYVADRSLIRTGSHSGKIFTVDASSVSLATISSSSFVIRMI